MKVKNLLATLLLFLCTLVSLAQTISTEKLPNSIAVNAGREVVFDKTIDYLQAKDFFIQSVDKEAGFIQAKVFIKNRKLLSSKVGERRTMNFILRPQVNHITITLTVYSEGYFFSGNLNGHYYEDNGIVADTGVYQEILSGLKQAVDQ